jgi:hypothetical protein
LNKQRATAVKILDGKTDETKNQFRIQTKTIAEEMTVIMVPEMVSCYVCPAIAKSMD